jgi:hypothetical protein
MVPEEEGVDAVEDAAAAGMTMAARKLSRNLTLARQFMTTLNLGEFFSVDT